VLASLDGPGGSNEFTQLLAQLLSELKPVGVVQNWQVQRLAISMGMQSLVLRSQMAKFQKHNALSKLAGDLETLDQSVLQWEEMRSARDSKRRAGLDPGALTDAEMECIRKLHENAAGIKRVSSFLAETLHDCETTSVVTKEQQDLLREHLGHEADTMLLQLSARSPDQEDFLNELALKSLIFRLEGQILEEKKDPDLEELIPPDEKAELLLRYYAFYSREAEHAIAELERLQSRQSGKLLLPPVKVDVTAGN